MIWTLLPFGLVAILVAGILVSYSAAYRFMRLPKGRLTGKATNEKCLKGGESFAIIDEQGKMYHLNPEEAQMMKKLLPKFFEKKD
jgi:hypothetical protein